MSFYFLFAMQYASCGGLSIDSKIYSYFIYIRLFQLRACRLMSSRVGRGLTPFRASLRQGLLLNSHEDKA